MAENEDPHVLDMSNRGLKRLEKRDGVGIEKLFLDHNELSKLDNIDCFLDVQKLSASHNQITRMYSLARLSQLSSIDLSNNLITCIEALKDLKYLVSVNLSNNRIKSLQSIQYSTTLVYLDLSGNLIPSLIDLTSLTRLKTLLLKRNEITTLQKAQAYLPSGLCVFSVAENKITDLTEVSFLSHLSSLESFSIGGNPCVNMTGGVVGFDYRPYVINWCLGLRVLDDFVVTQRESLKAEWLYSQGKGRCFHLGDHLVLVEYLSQVCPLTGADQMESEDEERISRILRMQRQHREQLLHEMSPAAAAAAAAPVVQDNARHHHHQQQHTPSGNRRPKSAVGRLSSSRQACLAKDKWSDFSTSEDERGSSVFDPFPDLLAHSDEGPSRSQTQCQLSDASEMLGAELTRSAVDPHSPVTVERVSSDAGGNERSRQRRSRKDDIMTRSVPEFRSDGSPILHNYGKSSYGRTSPRAIPVRKVSTKRTEPPSFAASGGIPSTRSFEGCAVGSTTPTAAAASSSRLHQRSPSDGGLSRSASFRTPAGRSPYATASPRKTQRSSSVSAACPLASTSYSSVASPHKAPTRMSPKYCNGPAYMPTTQGNLNVVNNNNNNNIDVLSLVESDPLLKQRSQAVGLEVLDRAAVRIQALWRGYRTRNHMSRVRNACQEVRLRRLEECILDVQTKMAITEQALLRQQKEIEEERKYRNANKEALDRLLKQMEQLETHIAKVFQQHVLLQQQLAQHYSSIFKPIHNEPHSESSSSEATVGNSVSTTSSATSHSPAKDVTPKDPEKDVGKPASQGDVSGCAEQPKSERRPEFSHQSSHEQASGDATSADDTSCASFSEAEMRSSKTEVEPDTKRQTPANLEAACLTEVNDRLARLEAVIMKLAIPESSLEHLGATFAKP